MGDNSYGTRLPWQGQGQQAPYNFQPGLTGSLRTPMDPRLAMQMRPPVMNGYPGLPQAMPTQPMPTPVPGTYPLWDVDVPSQMFMQAVNFDRLMTERQPNMGQALNTSNASEDLSQQNDSSRDLIEQQQAMEQARLLQRFKELRSWQQQQQEMLMSQQQQQLSLLRKEQERMQSMIAKQRDNHWGRSNVNNVGETATPPRRQIPAGVDIGQLMGSAVLNQPASQNVNSLPKPVMYVQPKDDDDEIKTNPDLFSDTNSNRGSQATVEDGMFPIPDSASEASVEVGQFHMQKKPIQYRQRLNKHELDAPKKHHRSFAELEADAEFLNLSSQSPTFLDMHSSVQSRPNESKIAEEEEEQNDDDGSEDDEEEEGEEDDSSDNDDDDDEEEASDDESAEEGDTQIEIVQGKSIDDVPIRPGIEGGKTFEQMLEEQLKAEEERLKKESASKDSPHQTKRTFLKKGQGIARFDQKPEKKASKPKKSLPSTTTQKKSEKSSSTAHSKPGKSSSKVSNQTKSPTNQKPPVYAGKHKTDTSHKPETRDNKTQKQEKESKLSTEGTKISDKQNKMVADKSCKTGAGQKVKKAESIPDDASFVASLKERQKESEQDLQDLDEFEILEQFADDMSFCSNSSIVTKGLRGLQSDRILSGPGSTNMGFVRPASPRAAFIKKLEQIKEAKANNAKQQALVRHSNVPQNQGKPQTSAGDLTKQKHVERKVSHKNTQKLLELEKSESSDDDDDDSDDDDEEDDSESDDNEDDRKKGDKSSQVLNKNDKHRDSSVNRAANPFHIGNSVHDFGAENFGGMKNDLQCSTDKKLARVLSYTAMTETSISQTSGSEQDLDSDTSSDDKDSEEDFVLNESPSKIVTRKIASKSITQTSVGTGDYLTAGFNSSAFVPNAKSPIVISKEKVGPVEAIKEDVKYSYHSDSDSVGNRKNGSFSDEEDKMGGKSGKLGFGEKKTLQFDDDDEWTDMTPKLSRGAKLSEGDSEHDRTLVEETEKVGSQPVFESTSSKDTPPTSKLVTKLFPNLKSRQQQKEEQDLEKVKVVSQVTTGEGVQSKILRDKLVELEREIEKFRNENSYLAKLRTEREEGLSKLKKEIMEFEKEKVGELKRIEEFRNEEMKKLKHERKMFDKYQKAARAGPDKKEREEIETLKLQLSELQEEMKRKESRWQASQSRLRDKLEHLEQENEELKEEVKLLEKKRLEWMQRDDKGKGRVMRSSTPTEDFHNNHDNPALSNGFSEHHVDQSNELSSLSSARGQGPKSHPGQSKVNIRSSYPPSQHSQSSQSNSHSSHTMSTHSKHTNTNQSAKSTVTSQKGVQPGKKLHTKAGSISSNQGHGPAHTGTKPGQKTGPSKSAGGVGKTADVKSTLRTSLAEDVPRRELGTTAAPQDVSMYSEGDVSVQAPSNLPRKFAPSKYGVDRSVIDKGDNSVYDEIQHSDGKVERTYRSGAREILFTNGTRKEISSDGKSIIVSFFNGDVKQIMSDQRVIYYYAENKTTHTNYPDGLEILHFPNDQTEKLYPDGTKEITFPDQTVKYIFPNGSEESIFPDGTVIRLEKNGDKTMEFPNGQREIHTQEFKRREYPDGTVKTVYPDGRQETRYSNGRLRVKDRDGNVVVDSHC